MPENQNEPGPLAKPMPETLRALVDEVYAIGKELAQRHPEVSTDNAKYEAGVRLKALMTYAHQYLDESGQGRKALEQAVRSSQTDVKLLEEHYATMRTRAAEVEQHLLATHAFVESLSEACAADENLDCHNATSPEQECDFHRRRREALAITGPLVVKGWVPIHQYVTALAYAAVYRSSLDYIAVYSKGSGRDYAKASLFGNSETKAKHLAEGLRQSMKKGHHDTCSHALVPETACDCGYATFVAILDQLKEAP